MACVWWWNFFRNNTGYTFYSAFFDIFTILATMIMIISIVRGWVMTICSIILILWCTDSAAITIYYSFTFMTIPFVFVRRDITFTIVNIYFSRTRAIWFTWNDFRFNRQNRIKKFYFIFIETKDVIKWLKFGINEIVILQILSFFGNGRSHDWGGRFWRFWWW